MLSYLGLCGGLGCRHVLIDRLDITVEMFQDFASTELVRAREQTIGLWWMGWMYQP